MEQRFYLVNGIFVLPNDGTGATIKPIIGLEPVRGQRWKRLAGSESLLTCVVQVRLRAKPSVSEIRKFCGEERILGSSE